MLVFYLSLGHRLINFNSAGRWNWLVRCLLSQSSMSVEKRLLIEYHQEWLYIPCFEYYFYIEQHMPDYFQIRTDNRDNYLTLAHWLMAYLLIQFETLTSILIVNLLPYTVTVELIVSSFCYYYNRDIMHQISDFVPNIIIAIVFRHRPDRQLLALLILKSSIAVIRYIEKRTRQYFIPHNVIEVINLDDIGDIGGDNGLD